VARAADAPFVLLVESQREVARERALLFRQPLRVIKCRHAQEVPACLSAAEAAVAEGHHVAGFLAYEASYGLHEKLAPLAGRELREHVLWLGVFERALELRGGEVDALLAELCGHEPARVSALELELGRAEYAGDFARIQDYLHAGESYQVCHSLRARFNASGTPAALFRRLRAQQATRYSALLDTGEYSLLSLSPELFFRKQQGLIELKPMKGTAASGRDADEDSRIAAAMRADPKTRAENVMIVDLLRNDIGRLALPGSVRVPELFAVERFDRVLQMTSTILADVEPSLGLRALLQALFPSGSVTGAPKLRTQHIIHELEPSPRGIFCGSIGYVTPHNDMCFNVAIRSLLLDRAGRGVLGVGSGVVVDSTSDAEYDECLLKARFLASACD
jgi:para-aminobenzoate synthetase / 4-amino-4-deoxychorismate lyase